MVCAARPQSRIGVEQFTMQVHGLIGVEQSRIGDNQGLETGVAPEYDLIVTILLQNKSISSSDGVIMLSVLLRDLSLPEVSSPDSLLRSACIKMHVNNGM